MASSPPAPPAPGPLLPPAPPSPPPRWRRRPPTPARRPPVPPPLHDHECACMGTHVYIRGMAG
eukprot:366306-Chlamydomonas_euryale.AAC.6